MKMKEAWVGLNDVAWVEGFAIFLAVVICSVVTATNDYQKANKFRELFEHEQEKKEIQVIRGGKRLILNPEDILVGDLTILHSGMEIQGDGVLIDANEVEVDESSMSGESEPQRKDILRRCLIEKEKLSERHTSNSEHSIASPIVLSGTKVRKLFDIGSLRRRKIYCNQCWKEFCKGENRLPHRY